MKNVNVNDFTSIINTLMGLVPKLAALVGFVLLAMLLWEAIKARGKLSFIDKCAFIGVMLLAFK